MKKVVFTRKNGCRPFHIYDSYKYFIQDYNVSNKRNIFVYNYALKVEKIEEDEPIKFNSFQEARDYTLQKLKNERYIYLSAGGGTTEGYEVGDLMYCITGSILTIRKTSNLIADGFETYEECLKFSKQYVRKVREKENVQLSMF